MSLTVQLSQSSMPPPTKWDCLGQAPVGESSWSRCRRRSPQRGEAQRGKRRQTADVAFAKAFAIGDFGKCRNATNPDIFKLLLVKSAQQRVASFLLEMSARLAGCVDSSEPGRSRRPHEAGGFRPPRTTKPHHHGRPLIHRQSDSPNSDCGYDQKASPQNAPGARQPTGFQGRKRRAGSGLGITPPSSSKRHLCKRLAAARTSVQLLGSEYGPPPVPVPEPIYLLAHDLADAIPGHPCRPGVADLVPGGATPGSSSGCALPEEAGRGAPVRRAMKGTAAQTSRLRHSCR